MAQKGQGSLSILPISNFLFFSVSFSPVAGSAVPEYVFWHQRPKNQNTNVIKLVNRFMNTAVQYTQLKFPVFLAITLAVAFPTKDPILPMPSSKPKVEAKPLEGANQELKTLYCATWVAMSPKA